MKDDITVIIPVHEYNDTVENLLKRAIKSVPNGMNIVVSVPNKISEKFSDYNKEYENLIVLTSINKDYPSDFCSLVNMAVETLGTKWFSILEFDDEYTDVWENNMRRYINVMPENSVFLSLTELVDFNSNKFVGYGNEAPWATSFSSKLGVIDSECLQQFFDFYLTGSVFNTKDWNSNGGLKPSIKLTFWYEFLLRMTNKNKGVFVVPKLGYKHYINREHSLYDNYKVTLSEDESKFWFELAQKEYFYTEDRKKTYENKNEKGE